jgi:integrase/recombinase XerD
MRFRGPRGLPGQRRNYSDRTANGYVRTVAAFAKHFGKPPDKLGPDDLRSYQAYLLKECKLAVGTVIARVAALRFFFVRTLKRHEFRQDLPYPKKQRRLPTVLKLGGSRAADRCRWKPPATEPECAGAKFLS